MNKSNILLASLLLVGSSAFAQKLSPSTSLMLQDMNTQKNVKSATAKKVDAFITVAPSKQHAAADCISRLEALGVEVRNVVTDRLLTVSLPLEAVEAVAALDEVENVQVGTSVRMLLDTARKETGVDDCHSTTSELGAYTGKGVVVGVVDGGFQYSHVDFTNPDGIGTRIARVWNQNANGGKAPSKFGYGSEYVTYDEMRAVNYDISSTFHGSHVAGIAAGSDRTTPYYGVAPESELVFVSFGSSNVNVTDGIQYCFDYAESVGKPCVVNISLGSHLGPHDGTSASDQAFAAMAGPGRIIVGAAGNEGGTALHVGKDLEEGDTSLKTMIGFSESSASKLAYVDIWGSKGAPLKVKAVVVDALKGKVMYESPAVETDGETDVKYTFPDGSGVVSTVQMALQKNPTNERTEVMLMCRAKSIAENRKIGIVATSDAGTSIHMWNNAAEGYFLNGGKRGWTEGDTDYTVGELGGVSDNVISVGSYNTKMEYTTLGGVVYGINTALVGNKGALSLFSSHGPTLDGRTKPDVTAPGCLLISATSKYYADFSSSTCVVKSGDDYYDVNLGTSMASPVVTGTVALWLQANPNLSPADVRAILNKTARHDNYTGTAEKSDRNSWGAGKIDAFAGLKMALDATGIKDTKAGEQMFSITTDRVARTAQFFFGNDGAVRVAVYNALGQQVYAKQIAASGETVDFSQLGNGVFVVKLQQGSAEKSVKIAL